MQQSGIENGICSAPAFSLDNTNTLLCLSYFYPSLVTSFENSFATRTVSSIPRLLKFSKATT